MLYAANKPNSEALAEICPWWPAARTGAAPRLRRGTRALLTAVGVSQVTTNEGFSPKNITFPKQMNPLDQSADESALFKRFLEGT